MENEFLTATTPLHQIVDNIINHNVQTIPYEGDIIDRQGLREEFINLIRLLAKRNFSGVEQ